MDVMVHREAAGGVEPVGCGDRVRLLALGQQHELRVRTTARVE
jgi:hypothetical protein